LEIDLPDVEVIVSDEIQWTLCWSLRQS